MHVLAIYISFCNRFVIVGNQDLIMQLVLCEGLLSIMVGRGVCDREKVRLSLKQINSLFLCEIFIYCANQIFLYQCGLFLKFLVLDPTGVVI